ncbi:zinc finger domain-containing protein [Ophiocordyceps sinensis CO18]|uniref:Zinc finger domain-containing protein n=1 Tax=Ophiocordyceps sinensis (strain Co18 / CGMCC 3.14243) TaxID=911162 RepID=T5A492_OPHSC|nr:zinc finger domain-containing protein [Ophiocordyceps sinensis CO18]
MVPPPAARPIAMSIARPVSPSAAAGPVPKAPPAPKPSTCRKCETLFTSRNALFKHLRRTYPGQQKAPVAVIATVPAPAVNAGCKTALTPALAVIEAVCATVLAAVVRRLTAFPATASASPTAAINAVSTTIPAAIPPDKLPQQHLLPAGNISP